MPRYAASARVPARPVPVASPLLECTATHEPQIKGEGVVAQCAIANRQGAIGKLKLPFLFVSREIVIIIARYEPLRKALRLREGVADKSAPCFGVSSCGVSCIV